MKPKVLAVLIMVYAAILLISPVAAEEMRKPNFVVFFCDDLGYADIGCFGAEKKKTPHIDKMANEGMRFTDFYVGAPVCTPSRASLMTGCYPLRVDLVRSFAGPYVLLAADKKGLNPAETTIAEVLREQGYKTACIGKWHLGDQQAFLPTQHGFDYWFGIPFSNDYNRKKARKGQTENTGRHLPLFRNDKIIELSPNQRFFTRRLTQEAQQFIRTHKDEPFFVYIPHIMPHRPVYAGPDFEGKSSNGIYSDAIEEIDWSVGEVLNTLKELDLDKNTLVVFTSDNGAVKPGENQPLARGKGSAYEAGMRVPCVMRWPETIPASTTCRALTTVMDLLPTFAHHAGGQLPKLKIDGKDITALMTNPNALSPHEKFFYYRIDQLRAVRSGKWKLHLACDPLLQGWDGNRHTKCDQALYDLEADIGETTDVSANHPDVVKRLLTYAEEARSEIGDWKRPGSEARKAGWCENPVHPVDTTTIKPTLWDGNPDKQ